ncbi:MAG: dipicolinate synthase subunit B [Oscillospiraceae bacterium]|nr:dipicolinate synthase subunit B [Oscillospiraceae bacterium]
MSAPWEGLRAGFAMCGSFCTFEKALSAMRRLREMGADIVPILSERACSTDTRFGAAEDWRARAEALCGRPAIHTLKGAEPIGPKALLDILIVAPCTGNTLGKLSGGVTDTCVTMACKAHTRNGRPLVLAVSTNDGLGVSAKSIGELLTRRGVYFVPFGQDDPAGKPRSLAADLERLPETAEHALRGEQIQPILIDFLRTL